MDKNNSLDADILCIALEENGAIANRLSAYERRDAQLDFLRLIVRAFNEDSLAAAEAGTGVGKSFAYLLPALEFALSSDERIVISTATITLQEQLYEKDIPLVLSALEKKVKCCLVKGRGNYLCLRRLSDARLEQSLDSEENEQLRTISVWAGETKTGSRSDIPFLPEPALWSRLCSESDTCLGMQFCPEREHCFFMALRREAANANILIVNHHLLFADLAARHEGAGYESMVVLPPFTRVIIDEAHTMETAASSFFSKGWSRLGINRALSRLYRKRGIMKSGLLVQIGALLPASALNNTIPKLIKSVREAAEKADDAALALCGTEGLFRFTQDYSAEALLNQPLELLQKTIIKLCKRIDTMLKNLNQEEGAVWEAKAILRRLESVAELCRAFLEFGLAIENSGMDNDNDILWLERQGRTRTDSWAAFNLTPLSIGPILKDALFQVNKTVICVSATLSTAPLDGTGSGDYDTMFRFWADRCGATLADRELLYGIFPSPFPYSQRTLLAVPSDAPLPDVPEYQDFTVRAINSLVRISGGSALVLFTSYHALQNSYEQAAPALEEEGIRCLKQGDDDRSRLLEIFLNDQNSVLFGTDSFWEGVDIPGEALRLVIICRLPFRTLKDPVFEARRELLDKNGRSSFMELSLPDAVMKFKQGFGRLMRSSSDYGAVVVLDGRIFQKRYGKAFLDSLPETKTSFNQLDTILRDLEQFLF